MTSYTKIDNSTIQLKLKKPYAALIQSFSNWEAGSFYVYPKEGRDNAIDFNKYAFGAGPYYYDKTEPAVGMTLKRNPYYEERSEYKLPFADGVDMPELQDPSAVQGQLRVGDIWHQGLFALRAEDILKLKQDVPDLVLTLSYPTTPRSSTSASTRTPPSRTSAHALPCPTPGTATPSSTSFTPSTS